MERENYMIAAIVMLLATLIFVLASPPRCVQEKIIETRWQTTPTVQNL